MRWLYNLCPLCYRLLVHRDLDDTTIQELFTTELIAGCIMNMVIQKRYRLYSVLLGPFSVLSTLTKYIRTNDVFIEAPYKHTVGVGI